MSARLTIRDFAESPENFMMPNGPGDPTAWRVIRCDENLCGSHVPPPDQGFFKLELRQNRDGNILQQVYDLKWSEPEADDNVYAYFLRYNGRGEHARLVSLSGCSVIVTERDANTYRVFHDARGYSSTLYDNVTMAMDAIDYSTEKSNLATIFMQYRNGSWNLFGQLQDFEIGNEHIPRKMPQGHSPVIIRTPGLYNKEVRKGEFTQSRNVIKGNLLETYKGLGGNIISSVEDGAFEPFEGSNADTEENPATKPVATLRDTIDKLFGKWVMELSDGGMQAFRNKWKFIDANKIDSKSSDNTYLWLKQKEARGIDAVVIINGQLEASLGGTVGERFADQQLDLLLAFDADYVSGFNNYKNVTIPGFNSTMPLLTMMAFFDKSSQLPQSQKGALVHYINLAAERRWRDSVAGETDKIVRMFQEAGGFTQPTLQKDFFLNAVSDEYGSRCYPLVRAMAVALSRSDDAAVHLSAKLANLTSENDLPDARLLRNCLKDLHSGFPAAKASIFIEQTNLRDAVGRLEINKGERKILVLNTENHSMLLGATNDGGTTLFHFYDPNFMLVTFSSLEKFLNSVTKFFMELGYAGIYDAFGLAEKPTFKIVRIDAKKMGDIQFNYRLNVGDFFESQPLAEIVYIKKASGLHLPAPDRFTKNIFLRIATGVLEAAGLAEACDDAMSEIANGPGENWMPILATLEEHDAGYQIQCINLEDPSERKGLSINNPVVKKFKTFLDERLAAIRRAYRFEGGTFIKQDSGPDGDTIDGLAELFLVNWLINNFNGRKNQQGLSSNLAIALQVHSYINLAQYAVIGLGDISKIVQLTETVIRSEEAAQSSLTAVTRAIGRASEIARPLLDVVFVGFDVYELVNAQSDIQKAVFGTQLAFDSASLLVDTAAAGASLIGASSTAAILGGAGVLLTGVGVGVGALVIAFGRIAEEAKAVGQYFGDAEQAYKTGGYKYNEKDQALIPLVGAVITHVDLCSGTVKYDSQYIYRTHHGSTGSGYENYFFWVGDFPQEIHDRNQAINVREGIGAPSTGTLTNLDSITTFVLPATPMSYINYTYQTLPGATTRHDYGFDVIRRLEVDRRFDYDFYIFPSEYIVNSISHEYVNTPVTIQLNERRIRLQAAKLPSVMQNHLSYTLKGVGSDYIIGMQQGVSFTLSTKDALSNSTKWILDCQHLTDDTITVDHNGLTAAGIRVTLADRNFTIMLIITGTGEVTEVDFDNQKTSVTGEDASKYPGGGPGVLAHLNDLNKKHLLHGSFIIIEHYGESLGVDDGRAFYDVTRKRVLYTIGTPESLESVLQLGPITPEDEVFFYNTEKDGLWRTDPSTKECLTKYNALYPSSRRSLMRVWLEGDRVLATYSHTLDSDKNKGELTYVLGPDSMTLVSAIGDNDLLKKLDTMDRFGPVENLLEAYKDNHSPPSYPTDILSGKNVKAETNPRILAIYGKDNDGDLHRYWLRLKDRAIIKLNLEPLPPDIIFAGTVTASMGGKEEFCFYSLSNQKIYFQTGTGTSTSIPQTVILHTNAGRLSNVLCVNNELFAQTDAGYILHVTTAGTLFLEAVTSRWFEQFKSDNFGSSWWDILENTAQVNMSTIVAVFGLEGRDNAIIPAWYYNGRIVVAAFSLHGKQIQLVGLVKGGHEAWLCYWEAEGRGHLFRQPLISEVDLSKIFTPNTSKINSDNIPAAISVTEEYSFKNVIMTDNGVRCTTTDGIILMFHDTDTINVYGVDASWQLEHAFDLEPSLAKLTQQWGHGEVIALQGPTSRPLWYIVSAAKVVAVDPNAKITWADNPMWLGIDIDGTAGYFYLQARGDFCSISFKGETKTLANLTIARRFDQLLVLGIPDSDSLFSLPTLLNVKFAVTSQTQGRPVEYGILRSNWDFYEANVLQEGANSTFSQIAMFLKDKNVRTLLANQIGDDLVIIDVPTGNSVTIRNAFAPGQSYDNISLFTDLGDTPLSVARIQKAQSWLRDKAELDALPYIPLRTVGHYQPYPSAPEQR